MSSGTRVGQRFFWKGNKLKEFKTIEQQILILKNRGLNFENEEFARTKLLETNYYNTINGYKRLFIAKNIENEERFIEKATYEELYYLAEFDRSIRIVYLENILKIENKLKTLIAHYFSEHYGHDNYLKIENFETFKESNNIKASEKRVKSIQYLISSIQKEIADSIEKKNYINHYIMKYGYIPLWVLINALSLGTISKFYEYMKQPIRVTIAKHFDMLEGDLCIFIKALAFWRNLCAHDERLYDSRSFKIISIPNTKYHELLEIPIQGNQYIQGKNDLFSLTIILKFLLLDEDFNHFYNKVNGRIYSIASKLKSISIDDIKKVMGFPSNWEKIKKS